ncbi:MAG: SDR family oxidoreductase [Burkholderiales bacterium]|nr:SDR family oxidoreductase [Burkholderiales bacterium]
MSYTTAKHAVVGMIRHAALELSADRVRVNGIAPGVVLTPLIAKAFGVPVDRADALVTFLEKRLTGTHLMGDPTMNRPYIVCHMMTALDGKITGPYMKTKAVNGASDEYERINASYHPQAWLCGRVTTDDNFTFYQKPALDRHAPAIPEGDHVAAADARMHYVSVDPSGKLGWKTNTVKYEDRPVAHVVEVLTAKASNAYRAFLRKMKISYIVAGKDQLDCKVAAEKLKSLFKIETLMLSGGGFINWSFLQAGLVDELSLVIAPVADGENDTVTLFEKSSYLPDHLPVEFSLKGVEMGKGDSVWLRYSVKNSKHRERAHRNRGRENDPAH